MDQRETFATPEQLYQMLSQLYDNRQTAALIVDNNGLTRIEGEITKIDKKDNMKKSQVTISGERAVSLEQVIAVNGIFRSDYSEC